MSGTQLTTAQIRQNFLDVADERSQKKPRQAYVDGGVLEFELPRAGIANYAVLDFQGTLTIGGAAGAINKSFKAPYNLFSRVTFEDYVGVTRVSASGYKLYEREIATKTAFDPTNPIDTQSYSDSVAQSSIGGGTGAVGAYPWNFSVIVPIALHENTTEGGLIATLPDGENTITVQLGSLSGPNSDSVLVETTTGYTYTLTGTVGCTYYYWDAPSGTPLPQGDFQLIHELREIKQTDNLNAGSEKTFTLPTGRTYMQLIQDLVLNDNPDTLDVSRVRFIIDGATPTMDEDLIPYLIRQRRTYKRDWPTGMFLFDFWRKPWTPNRYGSLQTGLTISADATTTGNTYTSILMESLYQSSNITNG